MIFVRMRKILVELCFFIILFIDRPDCIEELTRCPDSSPDHTTHTEPRDETCGRGRSKTISKVRIYTPGMSAGS